MTAPTVRVTALAALALALGAGACGGGGSHATTASGVPAHHNESLAAKPRGVPMRPGEHYLLVLKRITAVPDPWVDEIRVTTDGVARYRTYIGGHSSANGQVGRRISARRLARFRALVRSARLKGADRAGAKATPGGYYYTLQVRGRAVGTASGHLSAGVRPLIGAIDRLADRLLPYVRY